MNWRKISEDFDFKFSATLDGAEKKSIKVFIKKQIHDVLIDAAGVELKGNPFITYYKKHMNGVNEKRDQILNKAKEYE